MNIDIDLSIKGIKNAQKQLKDYKKELGHKCEIFVNRLADAGISVAKEHTHDLGNLKGVKANITYMKYVDVVGVKAIAIVEATDTPITQKWLRYGQLVTAEVSPLLMAEYGSGWKTATPEWQGTFPSQTHAFEEEWWWQNIDGTWSRSTGVRPSYPMLNAYEEMKKQIYQIASEVFEI